MTMITVLFLNTLLVCTSISSVAGFSPFWISKASLVRVLPHQNPSSTQLGATNNERKQKTKTKNRTTVHEIVEDFKRTSEREASSSTKKKHRRSRKKVDAPKQKYLYAAQRREMERLGLKVVKDKKQESGDDNESEDDANADTADPTDDEAPKIRLQVGKDSPLTIARNLGMNPALQSCDVLFTLSGERESKPAQEPHILGEVRVGLDDSQTGMYAYVINKPSGWAILEGNNKKGKKDAKKQEKQELKQKEERSTNIKKEKAVQDKNVKTLKFYDQDSDTVDTWDLDMGGDFDLSSVMTAEELEEFEGDGGVDTFNYGGEENKPILNEKELEKATPKKIIIAPPSRENDNDAPAVNFSESRPSVVSWLKELKAAEGILIRGGKTWKAIAGAVNVDDSGLVLLCPKDNIDNVFVDRAEYLVVVGNGKYLAPKGKKNRQSDRKQHEISEVRFESYAKLRKGRGNDIVTTSRLSIPDGASTCSDAVQLCQAKYFDGIRGDAEANPFERRANRRLVHCASLTASSLTQDDLVECESSAPDDIRLLSERRNHHEFKKGSFLGRDSLGQDEHTSAFREINGAADGWPGWIVDRYGKWLFVQHDEMCPRGPLPSLHDGYTSGVYYFASDSDRSITGSVKGVKPALLEGKVAPENIEIQENGIKYLVNFDDLSTGIFLDQRPQRSWLARHCTPETRVLNCFSHCGAFSVAAACAGAETVSLDLDKKWLDRIEPQLAANGIDDTDRHDCIYGDCFDWLARLSKRGEKYDIVILDPPSTSVGGKKKKRWSAKNDYDDLVKLAAPLVKDGGFLWTTTNSNQISPIKFARMCKKGLDESGFSKVKLDRIATMPMDFPSIGSQQVKNFVWKF